MTVVQFRSKDGATPSTKNGLVMSQGGLDAVEARKTAAEDKEKQQRQRREVGNMDPFDAYRRRL